MVQIFNHLFLVSEARVNVCVLYVRLFFLNQQSEYNVIYVLMCWLSWSLNCRLPNVMRSPPARSLVSAVTVD